MMSCSILAGVIFLATSLSALAGPSAWTDPMVPGSISATKTYSLKDDFYVAVNQQKLAVMTIPEGETNYGTFSEVGNANSARLIEVMKNGKGTSKDEQLLHTYYGLLSDWDYSEVYEVNSNYDPQDNSINIFPGILGGAFYREDMTREEMLAGIGMVIGHEISHAFDSQGSQFDATGAMADWWTEADKKAFDEKVNKLIAYYDNIKVNDLCGNCNGEFLSAEAIADLASIKCMLSIAKEDPNFDYDKFFRAYAGVWLRVMTPENELWRMTQDNHPLSYLRVNITVAQFDEFIKTYGITASDGMYIAPADRITVW